MTCPVCVLWYIQERNFSVVLDVLTRFRAADVEKAVKNLDTEQVDVLMKYIYRGFANPTENSCGILLSWHDKVQCRAGGRGCGVISRVLPLCRLLLLEVWAL